jgi:hypothetical protein
MCRKCHWLVLDVLARLARLAVGVFLATNWHLYILGLGLLHLAGIMLRAASHETLGWDYVCSIRVGLLHDLSRMVEGGLQDVGFWGDVGENLPGVVAVLGVLVVGRPAYRPHLG